MNVDGLRLRGLFVGPAPSLASSAVIVYAVLLVGAAASVESSISASLACYAVLLFVILTHLGFSGARSELQPALAGLALVAVLKVGAFVLPQRLVSEAYWEALPCLLALAIVVWLSAVREDLVPLGIASPLRLPGRTNQLLIGATGPLLAVFFSVVDPSTSRLTLMSTPVGVLGAAALSGLTLEIVFRGCLQIALVQLFGPSGIALTALLYAGLFVGSGSHFALLVGLATGLVWGALAARTRAVSGVVIAHGLFALIWAALH